MTITRSGARRLRSALGTLCAVVVVTGLAACGSSGGSAASSSSSSSSSPTAGSPGLSTESAAGQSSVGSGTSPASSSGATESARDLLPAAIKSSGVIRVGATISYPPNQFYEEDNKTPTGISIDLADALGKALGVKFEFTNVAFQGIIPGLMAKHFDVVINSMAVTADRNKQFTLLVYQNAAGGLLVPGGNPEKVTGLEDLCGKKVAVLQGAHFEDQLKEYSQQLCVAKGKPAIDMVRYDNNSDQYGSVTAGRTVAAFNSYDVAKYTADRSNGTVSVVDKLYPDQPYGAIFTPDNLQLAKAMQAALNQIIQDGSYQEVLKKWGAEKEAVETAKLMPATG